MDSANNPMRADIQTAFVMRTVAEAARLNVARVIWYCSFASSFSASFLRPPPTPTPTPPPTPPTPPCL